MLPILEPMKALLATRSHAFATCWQIERRDGTVLRFTDADTTLAVGGHDYVPAGGANASARQKSSQLDPQNLDFVGIIESDMITVDDLRAGLYREAKVSEILVDHRYPWAGEFCTTVYWVESVQFTGQQWTAKLTGMTRFLSPQVGRFFGRLCPYVLGDAKCTKDLTAFTFTAPVTAVGTNARKVLTASSLAGHGTNFFANGVVTFTSGANNGVAMEIRESTDGGQLTFFIPLPYNVAVADTFSVKAGCDHTTANCRDKFANLVNFGGFPFVPGNDKMLRYPNSKAG